MRKEYDNLSQSTLSRILKGLAAADIGSCQKDGSRKRPAAEHGKGLFVVVMPAIVEADCRAVRRSLACGSQAAEFIERQHPAAGAEIVHLHLEMRVGKSGRILTSSFLSIFIEALSSSLKLWGIIFVARPTAMPSAPCARSSGNFIGRFTGSFFRPS